MDGKKKGSHILIVLLFDGLFEKHFPFKRESSSFSFGLVEWDDDDDAPKDLFTFKPIPNGWGAAGQNTQQQQQQQEKKKKKKKTEPGRGVGRRSPRKRKRRNARE